MSDYDNSNRGALWRNGNKHTESHPDFTGSLNVDGVEYWLNVWNAEQVPGKNRPLFNVRVTPKSGKGSTRPSEPIPDDDIPF